jgi:hypothetical protein
MAFLNGTLVKAITVKVGASVVATAYIAKGMGDDNPYNRLFIVADGFDPGNTRKIQDISTSVSFSGFFSTTVSPDNYSPLAIGYDLCFVDFADGSADIRNNAKYFLKVVEYLCQQVAGTRVVVGGFRMGGVAPADYQAERRPPLPPPEVTHPYANPSLIRRPCITSRS